MLQRHVQVFSSDPTLVSYLARYLRARSCNIIEEEGKFYLRSTYFEKMPVLPDGFEAILELMNPAFATLSTPMKVEECKRAFMLVLNGIIKLKYKDYNGLARSRSTISEGGESGIDYEVDASGKRVYTALKDFKVRGVVAASHKYFRTADEQKPSTKKIWNIARSNASVARVLYHYTKSEDLVELRKIVEEVMDDTYTGTRDRNGKFKFSAWNNQKWSEPEILESKMEELWAYLHNSEMSHDQALHSVAFSNPHQANKFKAHGLNMSLQEARDIIRTLLLKWLKSKS